MSITLSNRREPNFKVSLNTYKQYPHEYTEYYRDILGRIVAPYRSMNERLGFMTDEATIILSGWGNTKARISELSPNISNGKKPYAVYYSSVGFISTRTEIQAGIPADTLLAHLPSLELATQCMKVDSFLRKVGELANWTVTGEIEQFGCKVHVEYPRNMS